jgi:uncharacterized protein (UPF0210 family)
VTPHPKEIYPILLDIGALALRLNKPLTARLMPIPGKKAEIQLPSTLAILPTAA